MVLQGLMALAAFACLFAEAAGFRHGFAIGGLVLMGIAVRKFLDARWPLERQEARFYYLEEGDCHGPEATLAECPPQSNTPATRRHMSRVNCAGAPRGGYYNSRR
ncbi:MAG: hypothetical protein LAN62_06710 [Acidobacteriia bacterium]|nr:hypothetical protein [Terriglobia bacterium]